MMWHVPLYPLGETDDCDQHDNAACNVWGCGFHIYMEAVIELLMMYGTLFKLFESMRL
jgi:hypothetical protein